MHLEDQFYRLVNPLSPSLRLVVGGIICAVVAFVIAWRWYAPEDRDVDLSLFIRFGTLFALVATAAYLVYLHRHEILKY